MTDRIQLTPIGLLHTPFAHPRNLPIQSCFAPDVEGRIELYPAYINGLRDLEEFSHLILIYHFHRSPRTELVGRPFLENREHGIFAIRSPHRPNHLGLSVVRLLSIKPGILTFSGADMLDQTPLLDIKPYVSYFDHPPEVKNGWLDKHFRNGIPPENTRS